MGRLADAILVILITWIFLGVGVLMTDWLKAFVIPEWMLIASWIVVLPLVVILVGGLVVILVLCMIAIIVDIFG